MHAEQCILQFLLSGMHLNGRMHITARQRTSLCATEDHCSRGLKKGGEWAWLFLKSIRGCELEVTLDHL